ncbi:MAG: uroporphyrinogen decarboxylase family protein [Oscillospiraceae bacterium]
MLTKRQNLVETIKGGHPDRFVNQYEFLSMLIGNNPIAAGNPGVTPGNTIQNGWGITFKWPKGQPGGFPVHDYEHKVIKDITKWKDVVKPPRVIYPEADWEKAIAMANAVDRNEYFAAMFVAPGLFEQCHHLMSMDDCLANFYLEPDAMHELIDFLTDYELQIAEQYCKYMKPDAIFHHDDWGSHKSSFMSPEMFEEFFVPSYKKIYGFYKDHGVELIVHHSDSYAANLVPHMIEMGIDIFQGCTTTNNVPELVKKYGGQISFMGDLDNGVLDRGDITREKIKEEVERACRSNGKNYFIPCLVRGLSGSIYPGVYEAVSEEIDRMSAEMF